MLFPSVHLSLLWYTFFVFGFAEWNAGTFIAIHLYKCCCLTRRGAGCSRPVSIRLNGWTDTAILRDGVPAC